MRHVRARDVATGPGGHHLCPVGRAAAAPAAAWEVLLLLAAAEGRGVAACRRADLVAVHLAVVGRLPTEFVAEEAVFVAAVVAGGGADTPGRTEVEEHCSPVDNVQEVAGAAAAAAD